MEEALKEFFPNRRSPSPFLSPFLSPFGGGGAAPFRAHGLAQVSVDAQNFNVDQPADVIAVNLKSRHSVRRG